MEQYKKEPVSRLFNDSPVLRGLFRPNMERQRAGCRAYRRMDNLLGRLRRHWNTYKQKQSEEDGGNDTN